MASNQKVEENIKIIFYMGSVLFNFLIWGHLSNGLLHAWPPYIYHRALVLSGDTCTLYFLTPSWEYVLSLTSTYWPGPEQKYSGDSHDPAPILAANPEKEKVMVQKPDVETFRYKSSSDTDKMNLAALP